MDSTDERIRGRIAALCQKTIANGCTEAEALAAAAKVADLLERHALTLDEVAVRESPCMAVAYEAERRKRVPLDGCVEAVAALCGCRTWREKGPEGRHRHVFFGLRADAEAARDLLALIDGTVRSELGRYKTQAAYRAFDHKARHLVNGSFVLGLVAGLADKLVALRAARDRERAGNGRAVAVAKDHTVEAAFAALGLVFTEGTAPRRFVAPEAYEAGEAAADGVHLGRR